MRYVVPQMLRGKDIETIRFSFRVKKEMENARVVVKAGEEVIAERKERIVRPPEMVKILAEAKKIWEIRKEVMVEVEEV